ncbi:MAG TPA: alpha/beta hydrolase [Vicinamibacterales bacterium]|nr:alpha/beta hydrolase [Vicinamibacterales bacterium]
MIVDRGSGPPLVLIPGLQGRWEYQRSTVDALAASFRVITFSLEGSDLDSYAQQVADALDRAGVQSAIVCGISFGGLIALRFASRHPPRCHALVLASTPKPALTLRRRHQMYLKAPWVLGPLFLVETPFRVRRELRAAMPDLRARRRFSLDAVRTFLRAPVSIGKMAARAKLVASDAVAADCARITAPTLVLTGEPHLDYVVPVEASSEYERLIPHARRAVLESTGHLGSMTRPREFAALVRDFAEGLRHAA